MPRLACPLPTLRPPTPPPSLPRKELENFVKSSALFCFSRFTRFALSLWSSFLTVALVCRVRHSFARSLASLCYFSGSKMDGMDRRKTLVDGRNLSNDPKICTFQRRCCRHALCCPVEVPYRPLVRNTKITKARRDLTKKLRKSGGSVAGTVLDSRSKTSMIFVLAQETQPRSDFQFHPSGPIEQCPSKL